MDLLEIKIMKFCNIIKITIKVIEKFKIASYSPMTEKLNKVKYDRNESSLEKFSNKNFADDWFNFQFNAHQLQKNIAKVIENIV